MGKTVFASVIAALLTTLITHAVLLSLKTEDDALEREAAQEEARRMAAIEERMDTIDRRMERSRRQSTERAAPTPVSPSTAAGPNGALPATAPDGTAYVSRAELDTMLQELRSAPSATSVDVVEEAVQVRRPRPLEEVAAEVGLSSAEEANLRIILRESEEEMLTTLFGDRPLNDIMNDIRDAMNDPKLQERMAGEVVQNAIANIVTLMTLERRRDEKIENLLGEERAEEFGRHEVEPVLGAEFEEMFGDLFD